MKLSYDLNLQQQQKLVMTPELKQSIEILQFSALELNEFINNELLENPVLEKIDDSEKLPVEEKRMEIEEKIDKINWDKVTNYKSLKYDKNAEETDPFNMVSNEMSLHEHLMNQLSYTVIEEDKLDLATYLIQCIDSRGYMTFDYHFVMKHFHVNEDEIEDIILTIQTFDPIGIGARDLKECLLIQTVYHHEEDKLVYTLINEYLEDIAANRLLKIAKELGIDIERVKEVITKIKRLNPKPGNGFSSLEDIPYIKPDVILKKIDGEYVILVNESSSPKLHISHLYKKMLQENINEKEVDYINAKMKSALKLIKNIEQRRDTIYKVVEAILEIQYEFFEKGPIYLKQLNLKTVAEMLNMHESTISRATSGKYIQCPNGLYELKYFFKGGVSTKGGDAVSSESIKVIIRDLIDKENKKKPLSDQVISKKFDEIGVKISRRTVAKYRLELNIPSTSKRKEY